MKAPTSKQLERWSKSRDEIKRERNVRLSVPVTTKEILTFMGRLVAVSFYPGEECWLYVGKRNALTPSAMTFKTNAYATMSHNGEVLGVHQFAYAVSEGILLSDLDGDVHHAARVCIGYRCCNPKHLELHSHREHAHEHAKDEARKEYARLSKLEKERCAGIVAQYQSNLVHTIILDTPPRDKRPVEFKPITGAGTFQRYFAGLPFLIRRSEIGAEMGDVRETLLPRTK
jgi:hypothetical protein